MLLEKLFEEFHMGLGTINPEQSRLFDSFFEKMSLKRNTFLIQEGEVERYSYFIADGIARYSVVYVLILIFLDILVGTFAGLFRLVL